MLPSGMPETDGHTPPPPPEPMGGMTGLDPGLATASNYRLFARQEAAGRSLAYEVLADAVAEDEELLSFLEGLPAMKRQPNLLFAAAWFLLGEPATPATLRRLVRDRPAALAGVMLERRTQTNEAARCAVLLPALAALPPPLSLLEVGASAGLTLLPDMYSYEYAGHRVSGRDPAAPTLACRPIGPVPLPSAVPAVAWRAGLDLNPLDVDDHDDVRWLTCLLWPGEPDRSDRLASAIATARTHRPPVWKGDLLEDLARVAEQAPARSTLVVYHSAVLAYVDESKRRAFADAVGDLGAVWLSNEGVGVLECLGTTTEDRTGFLLVRDGTDILARTDPHGTWMQWLGSTEAAPRPSAS